MSVFFRNKSRKTDYDKSASILQEDEIVEVKPDRDEVFTPELITVLSAMPLNLPDVDPEDPNYYEKNILNQLKSLQCTIHLYNIITITFWFMAGATFFASRI